MLQSGKGVEAAMEIIAAFSQGTFPKEWSTMLREGFTARWNDF